MSKSQDKRLAVQNKENSTAAVWKIQDTVFGTWKDAAVYFTKEEGEEMMKGLIASNLGRCYRLVPADHPEGEKP